MGNTLFESNGKRVMVYRVNGSNGTEKTIPHTANIEICYLNEYYGWTPKDRTRIEMLGKILEDEEATIEEIIAAIFTHWKIN
ncbi:hypothetical protein J4456_04605 [Candidatus Pacearchaeota archaeon]|nr:hypothetical protein [Candidatus Pacearchaeota archaeon]